MRSPATSTVPEPLLPATRPIRMKASCEVSAAATPITLRPRRSGAGLLFAIASVAFLGRCFGVLPDVRGLVTRGPYRLVRHPLYLGELTAALGIVLGAQRWAPALGAWLVCLGLQLVRTTYEERSLRAEFPEYAPYADRTKRLIPGLV